MRHRLDVLFIASVLVGVAVFAASMTDTSPEHLWIWRVAQPLVVGLVAYYWLFHSFRITLSGEGIHVRMGLRHWIFPWSTVGRVTTLNRGLMASPVEGLPLLEPGRGFGAQLGYRLSEWNRGIPLAWFDQEWRSGPIAEDLRRWAPHVFET